MSTWRARVELVELLCGRFRTFIPLLQDISKSCRIDLDKVLPCVSQWVSSEGGVAPASKKCENFRDRQRDVVDHAITCSTVAKQLVGRQRINAIVQILTF